MMLATLLAALDQTVVATALPQIVTDLHGFRDLSWVVSAFLVAATVTVPLYGKLSDLYGRRRMFVVAISIFLVGSLLCGLAQSMGQLIAFRALQGVGAGGLLPLSQAAIAAPVSPRRRPSPTCSPRASAAATRATSARCGRRRRSPDRCSAARSPTPRRGAGSSSSTCRSGRSRLSSSCARCARRRRFASTASTGSARPC